MEIILILLISFFATLQSSMSGGGASVIALPLFLSLGISLPMAVAIQKITAIFWVLPAAFNYLKGNKIDWSFLIPFTVIGLFGAYFGVLVIVSVPQRILEIITGALIVILVLYTYFRKNIGLKEYEVRSKLRKLMTYPFALFMGFHEIVGLGSGIIFAFGSFYIKGFDFIKALGYYYAVVFAWVVFASILFFNKGYFDLSLFIPAIIGSIAGGYFGSKYSRLKGNSFIRLMFLIIGGLLGFKLLIGI